MKSYCKGYPIGRRELSAAYADWASHTSGRKNGWRIDAEYGGREAIIDQIAMEIRERTLTFTPMRRYSRQEPGGGKRRELTVESCKQQICDYAVVHALDPMLKQKLGFWQYGGQHVRSNLDLVRAVKRWEQKDRYWVHLDVRKCYQSIGTELVRHLLSKYIRSQDVLYVADRLLDAHGEALVLGSYLSLRLCQWVLSFGYHHVESLHKMRRGTDTKLVTHQCWYADDIWLFGTRKRDLQRAARELERYLRDEFGLSLHEWQICRVGDDEPVDVAGYIVRPGRVSIRASAFLRIDRSRRNFLRSPSIRRARSLASHRGQLIHTDSAGYRARHNVDATLRAAGRYISRRTNELPGTERHAARSGDGGRRPGMAPQEHHGKDREDG